MSNHPLISEWMTTGVGSFLLLNALAEDARLLCSIAGFDQVLADLRNGESCRSAWHLITGAAMFQRAGTIVCRFYDQSQKSDPDFAIRFNSNEGDVEAKLLLKSDLEEVFEEYAEPLCKKIFAEVMVGDSVHPPVTVIIKDVTVRPDVEDVIKAASELLRGPRVPQRELRRENFNVFVDPAPLGKGLSRGCYILCPRSEKENLRVASRIHKASRQLVSEIAPGRPGIVWLGITRHQNAIFLRDMLTRKFNDGQHSGASVVFLLLSGTHVEQPRRSVVTYGSRIVNSKARTPLSVDISVKPLDLNGDLIALQTLEKGFPAYRVGAVEARYEPGMAPLFLPDFRYVEKSSLE